jgi:hypothetical protein
MATTSSSLDNDSKGGGANGVLLSAGRETIRAPRRFATSISQSSRQSVSFEGYKGSIRCSFIRRGETCVETPILWASLPSKLFRLFFVIFLDFRITSSCIHRKCTSKAPAPTRQTPRTKTTATHLESPCRRQIRRSSALAVHNSRLSRPVIPVLPVVQLDSTHRQRARVMYDVCVA